MTGKDYCENCGEEMKTRMLCLDGTNLEETIVCVNPDCEDFGE